MTRCKTKSVVHNVFGFAFNHHQTEARNALKAIVAIEQRDRKFIDSRRGLFKQSVSLLAMPSFKARQAATGAKRRVDLTSKQCAQPATLSRIPRSPDSRQKKTAIKSKTRAKASPSGIITSRTSLSSPDKQALPKQSLEDTSVVAEMAKSKQSVSNYHPQYITYHLGDPCTLGALDHLLACGHKILTTQPENCASNCEQPQSSHLNPRGIDEPFVCMACVTEQIKSEHTKKVSSFCAALEAVANATGKTDRETWIAEKVKIMKIAWRDLELEQMKAQAETGRVCHAFYIDDDYADLVNEALACRSVRPVTTPPKPRAYRYSEAGNPTSSPSSKPAKSPPPPSLASSTSRRISSPTSRLPRLLKST